MVGEIIARMILMWTTTVLLLPFPTNINAADQMLEALIRTPGVSGQEQNVRLLIEREVREIIRKRGWSHLSSIETDEEGNFVLVLGEGDVKAVFIAHMDEIGFTVNAINDDGTVVLQRLGGFYPELFIGEVIHFPTPEGDVPVLITGVREDGLFTGWTGFEGGAELGSPPLRVGDRGTIKKQYFRLGKTRRMGRGNDDRVGCTALLLALKELDLTHLKGRLVWIWSVREEIGLEGAKAAAERWKTPFVVAVDTFVSGDSPLESNHFAQAQVGKGAVLRAIDHSNLTPLFWVERVRALAVKYQIPLQFGVTGGGNDGAAFTPHGAVNIPLGWPLRYSHSAVEYLDLRDLVALADIVRRVAEDMAR